METAAQAKTRYVYLEAMRVLAAFFVIFNHTGIKGFFLFAQRAVGGISFWVYMAMSVFCKFSVPLFFAISGALMLDKEESLGILWKKRIMRIVLILVVFIFGNHLADALFSQGRFDWKALMISVYTGKSSGNFFWYGHLWYLYAYIAYLICLPFLRSMVRNLDSKYFYYMIAIALFFAGLVPAVEYLASEGTISMNRYLKPAWIVESVVLYPCIGYFLEHRIRIDRQKSHLLWLWLMDALGIGATCCMVYFEGQVNGFFLEGESQTFFDLFVLLNCITIFVSVKYLFVCIRVPQWLKQGILTVGKCSFGIYLFHIMVLDSRPMAKLLAFLGEHGVNSMLACLIQCLTVMTVCFAVTWVLRKIPLLRKLIGG